MKNVTSITYKATAGFSTQKFSKLLYNNFSNHFIIIGKEEGLPYITIPKGRPITQSIILKIYNNINTYK